MAPWALPFRGEPGVLAHFVGRRPCLYLDRHVGAGVLVLKCSTYMESISRAKETSRSRNALHVHHFQKFLLLADGGDPKQPLSCDMSLFEIPDVVLRPEA